MSDKPQSDLLILKAAANRLNEMVNTDPETMYHIFSPMWLCDPKLSETHAVCFRVNENSIAINALGVILGTLPTQTDEYSIALEIFNRKLIGFKVVNCKKDINTKTG